MKKIRLENFITKPYAVFFGAIICCALWGSAFPFIKIGYNILNIEASDWAGQIIFAGVRFSLAGIFTVLFGSAASKKILFPKKDSISKIIVLSFLQTVFQYVFFYLGLSHTTATKSSIINGAGVFFAVIISGFIFKQDRITPLKIFACLLGFAGVIILNLTGTKTAFDFSFFGEGFIILSALSYAFSSVCIKKFSEHENPVILSGYQFLLGGVIMTLFGISFGGRLSALYLNGVLVILYLAMVSAVAYTLWGVLLKYNPVSKVAVFGFMTQIFGCILSVVILGESLAGSVLKTISALILVSLGIFAVNYER